MGYNVNFFIDWDVSEGFLVVRSFGNIFLFSDDELVSSDYDNDDLIRLLNFD